jgi:hypothetical protein
MLDAYILIYSIKKKPLIVAERVVGLQLENWAQDSGL